MKYSAIQPKSGSPLIHIYESEPYLELTKAVRQKDMARAGAIIAEQIAASTGEDRLAWMRMQVSSRLLYAKTPRQKLDHWPMVAGLADEAGPDPDKQRSVIGWAQVLLLETERVQELARFCLRLRPGYALFMRNRWAHHNNRAMLHSLHGRWVRAYRAYTRSMEAFEQFPEAQKAALRGHVAAQLAERSICASAMGRLDRCEADLREARAIREGLPGEFPWYMYLAEAELALNRVQYARARAALQTAIVRLKSDSTANAPRGQVRIELLAARVARAEGNASGFQHFASRALAIATEHDLKLSEAEVRRVMDGAPH